MSICYLLIRNVALRLLWAIFVLFRMATIECAEIDRSPSMLDISHCPFVETLSFGSDIEIQCNSTFLTFKQRNLAKPDWEFLSGDSACRSTDKLQAAVNQCNITMIDSKYLQVPLKHVNRLELSCIYCRINELPIAPTITVTQVPAHHTLYTFVLKATGLASNESFEIIWAKRRSDQNSNSFNYWFSQICTHPTVNVFKNQNHEIAFRVDDARIDRVEFIIRRCNGACREYLKCSENEFHEIDPSDSLKTLDTIEKISCNRDCINGITTTTTTTTTTIPTTSTTKSQISSTPFSSNSTNSRAHWILFILLGSLIFLTLLAAIILYIVCKTRDNSRQKHVYSKTSNVDPGEQK